MTDQSPPDPTELTAESSLWQLYKASRRLPASKVLARAKAGMAVVLAAYSIGSAFVGDGGAGVVAGIVRGWATDGLSFSSQVIGFVLAGFTIFATMNVGEFTFGLARRREPVSGHLFLKYIYLAFMRVFALYVGFIMLCVAIRVLAPPSGPLSFVVGLLPLGVQEGGVSSGNSDRSRSGNSRRSPSRANAAEGRDAQHGEATQRQGAAGGRAHAARRR